MVKKKISFLDYICGGCEISFQVAIDFTASNGALMNPTSLHNLQDESNNQYIQAIKAVGGIL